MFLATTAAIAYLASAKAQKTTTTTIFSNATDNSFWIVGEAYNGDPTCTDKRTPSLSRILYDLMIIINRQSYSF